VARRPSAKELLNDTWQLGSGGGARPGLVFTVGYIWDFDSKVVNRTPITFGFMVDISILVMFFLNHLLSSTYHPAGTSNC